MGQGRVGGASTGGQAGGKIRSVMGQKQAREAERREPWAGSLAQRGPGRRGMDCRGVGAGMGSWTCRQQDRQPLPVQEAQTGRGDP